MIFDLTLLVIVFVVVQACYVQTHFPMPPPVFTDTQIVQVSVVSYNLPDMPMNGIAFHSGIRFWSPCRKVWLREVFWGGEGYSRIPAGTWKGLSPAEVRATKVCITYAEASAAISQAIASMSGE